MNSEEDFMTTEEVCDAMMQCIEDESLLGGTIFEVIRGKTRVVPLAAPLPEGYRSVSLHFIKAH